MKKVVERVQRENEALKKSPGTATQEQLSTLRHEHEKLKVYIQAQQNTPPAIKRASVSLSNHESCSAQAEYDRAKERNQLASRLESQAKGAEKIGMENERLRRDIRKVWEKHIHRSAEKILNVLKRGSVVRYIVDL